MAKAARRTAGLDPILIMEVVRVVERAAVAAARWRGRGDERAADQAAVDAMRRELNRLPIDGTVVIGVGERDAAPSLYIGESVGTGFGPAVDIALDPLEGTTMCAKNQPDSLAVIAIAEHGSLLRAPDIYMEKIAIGPGYAAGTVDLDRSPEENVRALAAAKGVAVEAITACILDRPRHQKLIDAVRGTGASVHLLSHGDVAGVIHVADPEQSGIDIYLGSGGAPEGVLAAAALRCIGGEMQGRLITASDAKLGRAYKLSGGVLDRKLGIEDMAKGDVLFAATGITDGSLLSGVRFSRSGEISTETVVTRSLTGTVRRIKATHRETGNADFED